MRNNRGVLKGCIQVGVASPVNSIHSNAQFIFPLGCNSICGTSRLCSFILKVSRPIHGFSKEIVTALGPGTNKGRVLVATPGDAEFVIGSVGGCVSIRGSFPGCGLRYLCRDDYNTIICESVGNRIHCLLVGGGHSTR